MSYSPIERHCVALIFATKKLHHSLLSYYFNLVTKSNPLNLLSWPPAAAEWVWHYCCDFKGLRSRALYDLLVPWLWSVRPSEEYEPLCEGLLCEEVCMIEDCEWRLAFIGFITHQRGGQKSWNSSWQYWHFSIIELEFLVHNEVHKALIIGLISALQMWIRRLCVQGDSMLIKQGSEKFTLKEIFLVAYRIAVQKLTKSFSNLQARRCISNAGFKSW